MIEFYNPNETSIASAILVAVKTGFSEGFDDEISEMVSLIEACDMKVEAKIFQELETPNVATYIGSGKVAEVAEAVSLYEASYVIFADSLSPNQLKNLTDSVEATVLDRTNLILEIFAKRAGTREARLQVESANLQYMLPRLVGMRKSLGRQGGTSGSLSNKGQGEKQIELDRRHIEKRISELRHELASIEHDRSVQRQTRLKSGIPLVSLVGYTNAGKSTIMNSLMTRTGAAEQKKVFEKNMLFATLDTTIRRVETGDRKDFLLSDTVGFVSNLPHTLVKAFRSTLEEAGFADLLLIVVDISDPSYRSKIEVTESTLKEIGCDEISRLYVYNKCDLINGSGYGSPREDSIYISAKNPDDIERLLVEIKKRVYKDSKVITINLPYTRGDLISLINAKTTVIESDYKDDCIYMKIDCPSRYLSNFTEYIK